MIFYHGTSEDNWKQIQKEGLLWGRRYVTDGNGNIIKEVSRCTYLAKEQSVAEEFGEVILEVEYNPLNSRGRNRRDKRNHLLNNYDPHPDAWQLRVYEPIPIENIKRLK